VEGVEKIPPHTGGGFGMGMSVAVRDIVDLGLTLLAVIGVGGLDVLRFESAAHPSSLTVQQQGDDTRRWCQCSFSIL